MKQHEYKKAK